MTNSPNHADDSSKHDDKPHSCKRSSYGLTILAVFIAIWMVTSSFGDHQHHRVFDRYKVEKDGTAIVAKLRTNRDFHDLRYISVHSTTAFGLYYITTGQYSFYYSPQANAVFTGTIYSAETGSEADIVDAQLPFKLTSVKIDPLDKVTKGEDAQVDATTGLHDDPSKPQPKEEVTAAPPAAETVKDTTQYTHLSDLPFNTQLDPKKIVQYRSYVDYDGKRFYRFQSTQNGTRLSDEQYQEQLKLLVQEVAQKGQEWSVVFKAPNEQHKLIVFTDTTCGYCHKFHSYVERLNADGISVYYLFYPRYMVRGPQDPTLKRSIEMMDQIWFSKDKPLAFTTVYAGLNVPESQTLAKGSDYDPVYQHYFLGVLLGLKSTPTFVTDDGRLFAGVTTPYEKMYSYIVSNK